MKADDIKKQFELIKKIERLREYAAKPVFYNSDFSDNRGSIPYSGNSAGNGIFQAVPGMLQDMEATGKRAIERELANAMREAERLGIEF